MHRLTTRVGRSSGRSRAAPSRTAGQAAGIAAEVQRATGDAIGAALGLIGGRRSQRPKSAQDAAAQPETGPSPEMLATAPELRRRLTLPSPPPRRYPCPTGSRAKRLWLLDQQRYPDAVQEIACTTLSDLSMAMLPARSRARRSWPRSRRSASGSPSAVARRQHRRRSGRGCGRRAPPWPRCAATWRRSPGPRSRMVAAWDAAVADTEDERRSERPCARRRRRSRRQVRSDVVAVSVRAARLASGSAGRDVRDHDCSARRDIRAPWKPAERPGSRRGLATARKVGSRLDRGDAPRRRWRPNHRLGPRASRASRRPSWPTPRPLGRWPRDGSTPSWSGRTASPRTGR